jgi:hypothetical protein
MVRGRVGAGTGNDARVEQRPRVEQLPRVEQWPRVGTRPDEAVHEPLPEGDDDEERQELDLRWRTDPVTGRGVTDLFGSTS